MEGKVPIREHLRFPRQLQGEGIPQAIRSFDSLLEGLGEL